MRRWSGPLLLQTAYALSGLCRFESMERMIRRKLITAKEGAIRWWLALCALVSIATTMATACEWVWLRLSDQVDSLNSAAISQAAPCR